MRHMYMYFKRDLCKRPVYVDRDELVYEHDKIVLWDRGMRQDATDVQWTCQMRQMYTKTALCKRPTYVERDLHLYEHDKTYQVRHIHLLKDLWGGYH